MGVRAAAALALLAGLLGWPAGAQVATFRDCPDCPEMTAIPAGTFLMGTKPDPFSPFLAPKDEQPQHPVAVAAFAVGTREVTQEDWVAVMGDNPSPVKGRTLPVVYVTWDEAQLFIQKLNAKTGKVYRLPTEAEWEYAARGGTTTLFSFGDTAAQASKYGWYFDIANFSTHPVAEKAPNPFGLYDVHGNAWEWVQDCYKADYVGAPADGAVAAPQNPCYRIMRGGSWINDAMSLRSATRNRALPDYRNDNLGFRIARTLP